MKNRKCSRMMVDVLPNNHHADENDVGKKKRDEDDTVILTYSSSSDDNNSVVVNKRRNNNRKRQQQQKSSKSQQSKSSKQEQRKRDKRGSVKTKKKVSPTTRKNHNREKTTIETNRYVALDCEMVGIGESGEESSLARVCIVDWDGKTLLDVHVQQRQDVTDYRTYVSGVTEKQLTPESGAITFEDCQHRVQNILCNDKIIVGHALKNDFQALKLQRSLKWYNIRDTAKYEPFMKVKSDSSNILLARKLKDLTKEHYGRDIQIPGIPHCPREDAIAALALYKKVRYRWEKSMEYKIQKTKEIERRNKQQQQQQKQ